MKLLPPSEAAPMIACVTALGDVQVRAAVRRRYEDYEAQRAFAAVQYGVTVEELAEARAIASRHGYGVPEAIEIVRRSRR